MIEFFASLFGFIQFATLFVVAILLILIWLGESGAFRFNHRELLPWLAAAVVYLLTPPFLRPMFYDFFLWLDPTNRGASVLAGVEAFVAAIIPAVVALGATEHVMGIFGVGRAPSEEDTAAKPVAPLAKGNSQAANMVTTALETAGSVQTRWQAARNTSETEARIVALQNAERLAQAASRTADAEAQAISAVIRRTDQLSQLYVCQLIEGERRGEYLEVASHQLTLADLRREKERYETARETLQSQHSLEATEEFKKDKFALGRARVKARQADVEVDSKTAEAAVLKIAAELSKLSRSKNPDINSWFESQIAALEIEIEEREADGEETREQREELAVLKRLNGTEQGAA